MVVEPQGITGDVSNVEADYNRCKLKTTNEYNPGMGRAGLVHLF